MPPRFRAAQEFPYESGKEPEGLGPFWRRVAFKTRHGLHAKVFVHPTYQLEEVVSIDPKIVVNLAIRRDGVTFPRRGLARPC